MQRFTMYGVHPVASSRLYAALPLRVCNPVRAGRQPAWGYPVSARRTEQPAPEYPVSTQSAPQVLGAPGSQHCRSRLAILYRRNSAISPLSTAAIVDMSTDGSGARRRRRLVERSEQGGGSRAQGLGGVAPARNVLPAVNRNAAASVRPAPTGLKSISELGMGRKGLAGNGAVPTWECRRVPGAHWVKVGMGLSGNRPN